MENIMEETRSVLAPLIAKPKMSDKLLGRPPFRFIHDIIFNLSAATGFPDLSIFAEDEMVGKAIKDRDAKIAFLDKAIAAVEQASGQQVAMRSAKAVAGQESDTVNEFLQLLGRTAAQMAAGGGGGGKEADDDEGESKAAAAAAAEAERRKAEDAERRRREAEAEQARAEAAEAQRRAAEEAERQRRDAEAAAAAAASKHQPEDDGDDDGDDDGKGGDGDGPFAGPVFVNGDMDRTAALLSHLISKPRMTEKLLSRPPYRFIHDVVTRLTTKRGLFDGLFEGEELNAKTKDRDVKLSYLTKLCNAVSLHMGVALTAQPAKVAAGKDPEHTNELLQYVGYCAVRGNTAQAVERVLAGETAEDAAGGGDDDGGAAAARAAADEEAMRQRRREEREQQEAARQAEMERDQQRRQQEAAAAAAADAARQAEEEQRKAKEAAASAAVAATYNNGGGGGGGGGGDEAPFAAPSGGGVRRLARPTTARRRPPRVRENAQAVDAMDKKPVAAVGIMKEGDDSDSDDGEVPGELETKADDVFGDGAVAAAGGAGKLTRDILDQQRAAESKNKANAAAQQEAQQQGTGIRMGRIKKSRGTGGALSQVDIDKLRGFIQKLCQSTNPLGKCMDYVHEDIEAMKGELAAWKADYKRRCADLETEQQATHDEIVPLQQELKQADLAIEDQVAKINAVKAKIAKNDARMQELLRMVVSW